MIIWINLDGIFVIKFIWGVVVCNFLKKNEVNKILIVLLVFKRVMVILLNFVFVNVVNVFIYWNVLSFFIVLVSLVKVFEIVMDNIMFWFIFIFVYCEVCWLKLIVFSLKFLVVLFKINYIMMVVVMVIRML